MSRRDDHRDRIEADGFYSEATIFRRASDHSHVERVLEHPFADPVGGFDFKQNLGFGIGLFEASNNSWQKIHAASDIGAQNQLALGCGGELANRSQRFVLGMQNAYGAAVQSFARLR